MSATPQRRYRFAQPEHWAAGLGVRTDGDALATTGIAPFLSYGALTQRYPSDGAFSPAVAHDGRVFWRDGQGRPHAVQVDDPQTTALPAPAGRNDISRIVVGRDNLWMSGGKPADLRCYDIAQMARRFIVSLPGLQLLDFSTNGRDGVWALATAEDAQRHWCVDFDCAGYERSRFALADNTVATQLAWLARPTLLALLTDADQGQKLFCYKPGRSEPVIVVDVGMLLTGFKVAAIGSDNRSRILLAGTAPTGASVLVLDADGVLLYIQPLPTAATGIHAEPDSLLVTTANGLLRFALDAAGGVVETSCTFVTPVLQSPLTDSPRRWLRAEALVTLPPGTSMSVSHIPIADKTIAAEADAIIHNSALTATHRQAALGAKLGDWQQPMHFRGDSKHVNGPLAMPLFDVHAQWLLVCVTLVATPDAARPQLHRLDVLYPGLTLMEHLPQIYQRAESEPGNFLRALVGVLETGTQEQDQRIAAMGSMITPQTAPTQWLDYLARWLDLPWDDALETQQKRDLLQHSSRLAAQRGTRAGLEALLQALLPGQPARYRVTDFSVQYGHATLGVTGLPSVLAGLPAFTPALNRQATIGKSCLACAETIPDDISHLVGWIAVSVTATAAERIAWQPWLQRLLGEMLPATARLRLHWRSIAARHFDDRLGADYLLEDPVTPHLNTDAVTGLTRLGISSGLRLE